MADLYMGIDTSNYKTSVSLTDDAGYVVYQRSEYLEVPDGSRGIRQSEAFFRHSCKLPGFIREMSESADLSSVKAIGVSSRPRRVEGSYMPCFLAGVNNAEILSSSLGIPLYRFSHQECHAAAIMESGFHTDYNQQKPSLLFHLSGGTTEFLLCSPDRYGYDLEIVGGTLDISIGQLLDRSGVAAGLPFPSGSYMDILACSFDSRPSEILPRITVRNGYFNLSGAETRLLREIGQNCGNYSDNDFAPIWKELFTAVSELLIESAVSLASKYGIDNVYMAGGVSASNYVRNHIGKNFALGTDKNSARGDQADTIILNIVFGNHELSGDNAVGTALLAGRIHNSI